MAKGGWTMTSQLHFLPFDKADDTIVLKLMAESICHLTGKKRVMFQAIEKIITGMTLGYKTGDTRCNLSQLDGFGTAVG
jgi:hypothetical protein